MSIRWCRSMLLFVLPRKLGRFRRTSTLLVVFVLCLCVFLVLYKTNHHPSPRTSKERMVPDLKPVQDTDIVTEKTTTATSTHLVNGIAPKQVNGRAPKQVKEEVVLIEQKMENDTAALVTTSHPSSIMTNQKQVYLGVLPSMPGVGSLKMLQKIMLEHNKSPTIYNEEQFLPLGEGGLVLIVQVHKREKYLTLLLESLKATKGIENVLLVISHDYYYDSMNKIITSIDFCQVSLKVRITVT